MFKNGWLLNSPPVQSTPFHNILRYRALRIKLSVSHVHQKLCALTWKNYYILTTAHISCLYGRLYYHSDVGDNQSNDPISYFLIEPNKAKGKYIVETVTFKDPLCILFILFIADKKKLLDPILLHIPVSEPFPL